MPQFTLALGEKVRRQNAIRNPALPRAFRVFEGEISFFVRCWWRLERGDTLVVSSNQGEKDIVNGLGRLVGQSLVVAKAVKPAWDLVLHFAGGWVLRVFPNQTETAHYSLRNWQARIHDSKIYAGPGTKLEIVVPAGKRQ